MISEYFGMHLNILTLLSNNYLHVFAVECIIVKCTIHVETVATHELLHINVLICYQFYRRTSLTREVQKSEILT